MGTINSIKSSDKNIGFDKTTTYTPGDMTHTHNIRPDTRFENSKRRGLKSVRNNDSDRNVNNKINTDLSSILRNTLQDIEADITDFNDIMTDFSF